jgi:hypothetical protein
MTAGLNLTRRELLGGFAVLGLNSLVPMLLSDTRVLAAGRETLADSQRALLGAVVDTIIPATDTPGALGAGVLDFVDRMVAQWLHEAERARFLAGMTRFDRAVRQAEGKPFTALAPPEQLTVLTRMAAEEAATKADTQADTGPFIAQIRALTIFGYYTAEVGASQELQLNLVPGSYEPCRHIAAGEHAPSISRSMSVLRLP